MTTQTLNSAQTTTSTTTSYTQQRLMTQLPIVAADAFLALAAFSTAAVVLPGSESVWNYLPVFLCGVGLAGLPTGMFKIVGVHPIIELRQTVSAVLLSMTLLMAASLTLGTNLPLAVLILAHLVLAVCLPPGRAMVRGELAQTSWWGVRCLVFGCNRRVNSLFSQHVANRTTGLLPFGFVEPSLPANCETSLRSCYIGDMAMAKGVRVDLSIHTAIVHRHGRSDSDVQKYIEQHLGAYSQISVVGDDVRLPASLEDGVVGQTYENKVLNPITMITKRMLDLMAAVGALVLGSPVLLALAIWTYISSPGPIFFGQERIGKDGRRLKVWKFRTMVTNAQEILEKHLAANPAAQAEWDATYKLQDDPRITTVGHLLRKTSLDELPQLWNVIKGEMSLVGPRPIVTGEIERYADTYQTYLSVRPGITGFWQVSGRNLTTYDRRVELDRFYVRNWSIWFDLYVLGRTIKTVICREGAF